MTALTMHLSIAIATWNRADLLGETIASLGSLHVPPGITWEVLVCDNNSSDHTKSIVQQAVQFAGCGAALKGKEGLQRVAYLFEPTQGKSHALNHLLREATGQWVLLLDDDVLVDPQWMAAIAEGIARYPAAAVFGGVVRPRIERPLGRRQRFLLEHYPAAFGVLRLDADTPIQENGPTPGGANMAVRRDVAAKLGFDVQLGMFPGQRLAGEDAGMALKIIHEGFEGWMLARPTVLHYTPPDGVNARRLWHWQMGIGRIWALVRGRPQPGRLGVAWWAWRQMLKRWLRAAIRWRPWPTKAYFDAFVEAAQYWGYLRSP